MIQNHNGFVLSVVKEWAFEPLVHDKSKQEIKKDIVFEELNTCEYLSN